MIMNRFKWIVVSTVCLLGISSVGVYGQNRAKQEDAAKIRLDTVNCRDLLKLGDSDREATIAYFHGFLSGKNNDLVVDVVKVSDASDKALDHCIDNPNDSLISVFEKYR